MSMFLLNREIKLNINTQCEKHQNERPSANENGQSPLY